MKTILNTKDKPEVDEMVKFLKTLTPEEQQMINVFIQGVKFAKRAQLQTV